MCKQCVSKSGRLLDVGRIGLGTGSAIVALLVPKCPLCVVAWAWALTALGVSFDRWDAIKWPLTAGFALLAALLLSFKVAEDSSSLDVALAWGSEYLLSPRWAYLRFVVTSTDQGPVNTNRSSSTSTWNGTGRLSSTLKRLGQWWQGTVWKYATSGNLSTEVYIDEPGQGGDDAYDACRYGLMAASQGSKTPIINPITLFAGVNFQRPNPRTLFW